MPKNKNSMSFLEGKLKAEKLNQNDIQRLFEAWQAAMAYEKICSAANADPKKDFDFEKREKNRDFLAKKAVVDNVYGLRGIFTKY